MSVGGGSGVERGGDACVALEASRYPARQTLRCAQGDNMRHLRLMRIGGTLASPRLEELTDDHICAECLEYVQQAKHAEYDHQCHLPLLREITHSLLPPLLLQQLHQKVH